MTTEETSQQINNPEKSSLFKMLVMYLTIGSVLSVVAGGINLLGAFSAGFSWVRIADIIFNFVFGVLIYICSRILAKGRVLALWILGGCFLLSMVYSYFMGRGINYVMAIVGVLVITSFLKLRETGEIS